MEELLLAIQAALRTATVLSYVRDNDIYITPSLYYYPQQSQFPCIGLKDGLVDKKEKMGNMLSYIRSVGIAIFVREVSGIESSIIGDIATSRKGVLAIEHDIDRVLDNNKLGIDGMDKALSDKAEPSQYFTREEGQAGLQLKILEYKYEGCEPRPSVL